MDKSGVVIGKMFKAAQQDRSSQKLSIVSYYFYVGYIDTHRHTQMNKNNMLGTNFTIVRVVKDCNKLEGSCECSPLMSQVYYRQTTSPRKVIKHWSSFNLSVN